MNRLERHIEILLLSNDCVIVPGFGGFMAHHVDARYDG
ncbi:SPOR domain-containing protein, partial [Prevotella copri]|nr:SPOR domain-containing protein [Segatella copri]